MLLMQETHRVNGKHHILPLICNINPLNTTSGESLFSALQQQFSGLQNVENRQVHFKLDDYNLCLELVVEDPHYLFSKPCYCWP